MLHPGRNLPEKADSPNLAASPHRTLDRLLLLGRESDGSTAAIELLHVDARVVAALDRGDDQTGTGRVEHRHRRRLVAARVLVRVVAHDRRVQERAVDETLSNVAVYRYDAYEGTGGHQSASVALLDAARSGVVVTAIQGRDYARIYMKELDRGKSAVALSPEELEAVERAMGR